MTTPYVTMSDLTGGVEHMDPASSGGLEALRLDPERYLKLPGLALYRTLSELHDLLMWTSVEYWRKQGARYVFLPITTNAVSSPMGLGSDSKPVSISLEGLETYLADSMQFFLEYACRLHDGGAFYLMPSFRGEACDRTHLSQFWHCEAELPLPLPCTMDAIEGQILHVCSQILSSMGGREELFPRGLDHVRELVENGHDAFTRVTFDEVTELLGTGNAMVQEVAAGAWTLTRAGEQKLMAELGEFVWVTHWDHLAVPFYQRLLPGPTAKAVNADLLFGPGEVAGAGERHAGGQQVREALDLHGIDAREYEWYVRMKDHWPMATSGFGMGLERFLMWILGQDDIRALQMLVRENGVRHVP